MKTELKAFHNDPAVKQKYLERVRAHRLADEIIQGTYWENGKGCAVGCTVHLDYHCHAAYEKLLGIPRALARIEDGIFEGLQNGDAKEWPEQFLDAIKVGADLGGVADKFLFWLLADEQDGVIRYAKSEKSKTAIKTVAELYRRKVSGEEITKKEWVYAAAAADYAAAAAAAYAAAAAAAYAAAAYAADYAYAAASSAASYAAAATDARPKARKRQAGKLIELLKSC